MGSLSPGRLIEYLIPYVTPVFGEVNIDKNELINQKELISFINEPESKNIFITKDIEKIRLSYSFGDKVNEIIICHKMPVKLNEDNFSDNILVSSFKGSKSVEMMRNLTSSFFIPYARNLFYPYTDDVARKTFNSLVQCENALSVFHDNMSLRVPRDDSNWISEANLILDYIEKRPVSGNIQSEISYYLMIKQTLEAMKKQCGEKKVSDSDGKVSDIEGKLDKHIKMLDAIAPAKLEVYITSLGESKTIGDIYEKSKGIYSLIGSPIFYEEAFNNFYGLLKLFIADKLRLILSSSNFIESETPNDVLKDIQHLKAALFNEEEMMRQPDRTFMGIENELIFTQLENFCSRKNDFIELSKYLNGSSIDNSQNILSRLKEAFNIIVDRNFLKTNFDREGWSDLIKQYDDTVKAIEEDLLGYVDGLMDKCSDISDIYEIVTSNLTVLSRDSVKDHALKNKIVDKFMEEVSKQLDKFEKECLSNCEGNSIVKLLNIRGVPSNISLHLNAANISAKLNNLKSIFDCISGKDWEEKYPIIYHPFSHCKSKCNEHSGIELDNKSLSKDLDELSNKCLFTINKEDDKFNITVNYLEHGVDVFERLESVLHFDDSIHYDRVLMLRNTSRAYVLLQDGLSQFVDIMDPKNDEFLAFCSSKVDECYKQIEVGLNTKWTEKTKDFADEFFKDCFYLASLVNTGKSHIRTINGFINQIETQAPSNAVYSIFDKLREEFDEFKTYISSTKYIDTINQRITSSIVKRIDSILEEWLDLNSNSGKTLPFSGKIPIRISVTSNVSMVPSFDRFNQLVINTLTEQINIYLSANLLQYTDLTFRDPVLHAADSLRWGDKMNTIYRKINDVYRRVVNPKRKFWKYVNILFTTNPAFITFPDDIEKVTLFYRYLKETLSSLDNSQSDEELISIVISRGDINKIVERIYTWQKYAASRLKLMLLSSFTSDIDDMKRFTSIITKGIPDDLKEISKYLYDFKRAADRHNELEIFKNTYREASDYAATNDVFSNFETELGNFGKCIGEMRVVIDEKKTQLVGAIKNESKELLGALNDLKQKWDREKPINGDMEPLNALRLLHEFGNKFQDTENDWKKNSDSLDLLGVDHQDPILLSHINDELSQVQGVWDELNRSNDRLNTVLNTPFSQFDVDVLKEELDSVHKGLLQMSNTVRQYDAWNSFKQKINSIGRMIPTMQGLRSNNVRTSHWRQILDHFGLKVNVSDVTISHIVRINPIENESYFSDILRNARGEYELLKYFQSIEQKWDATNMEFNYYNQKYFLIKDAPIILAAISDQLNFINSMHSSPFFHVFREQASSWERKLNDIQNLIDSWLSVERRFVYLDGIFSSSDIRNILVKTTSSFMRAEREFIKFSTQAERTKRILSILSIPDNGIILQGLNSSLVTLQKELSNYLEEQRSHFPRFFFIGDEDLLEIIGKSSSIMEIQKHFKKFFEGLTVVSLDNKQLVSMGCSEGEFVTFTRPVTISSAIHVTMSGIEEAMRVSLQNAVSRAHGAFKEFWSRMSDNDLLEIIQKNPSQAVIISLFLVSTAQIERHIKSKSVKDVQDQHREVIQCLSKLVFQELNSNERFTVQQLITELVHQRNVVDELSDVTDIKSFEWTRFLRYYAESTGELTVCIGDSTFNYGLEYLGLCQSLVRTPLTDRVYLTMAQALYAKLGGSPFGPAGTGKTETVKSMGHHLGRHVLIFNCDETFDFKAMGRIFIGLCYCGSWGCFDEFNRLDEHILSAISQQILAIQTGLREQQDRITLLERNVPLNRSVGIFVTMNPGYAGRVELPDNLKQLFRTVAMNRPDVDMITEVLLFSQGFSTAEQLAPKFSLVFSMAKDSLSNQRHYDFGLRAMKSVLVSAGNMIMNNDTPETDKYIVEAKTLVCSTIHSFFPKLVSDDIDKLRRILDDVFPGISIQDVEEEDLLNAIKEEADTSGYFPVNSWLEKVLQIYYIQHINHGIMLVGSSSTGKTSACSVLLRVLHKLESVEVEKYVINAKSVTKDGLFGYLNPITREWTDGIFTNILRSIVSDQRGEMFKKHWIIFDGDVDPEWAENLNSVLDDNKLLTLPNGERISLPPNVRIIFEVQNLDYATPATVSRCGIIHFSENTLTPEAIIKYNLHRFTHNSLVQPSSLYFSEFLSEDRQNIIDKQIRFIRSIDTLLHECFALCIDFWNKNNLGVSIKVPLSSCIFTAFSLLSTSFIESYHVDTDVVFSKQALFSIFWGFASPLPSSLREELDEKIRKQFSQLSPQVSIIESYVNMDTEDWYPYSRHSTDTFVLTNENNPACRFIQMVSKQGRMPVLFGSQGVGRKESLRYVYNGYHDLKVVYLHLANTSSADFVLQTIEQYCVYSNTGSGILLKPKKSDIFINFVCTNLNFPIKDNYGTQRIIEFLRQILDSRGFWHPHNQKWVSTERISFSGVCIPPGSYGYVDISPRFLRHTSIFFIDQPSNQSLHEIVKALLSGAQVSQINEMSTVITQYFVDYREKFKNNDGVNYCLTMIDIVKWVESVKFSLTNGSINPVICLYIEGIRLLVDKLVTIEHKQWAEQILVDRIVEAFPSFEKGMFSARTLYTRQSNGSYALNDVSTLSKNYEQVYSESFAVHHAGEKIVFFDQCTLLVSKIERRIAEPQGHLVIFGLSGMGKSVLVDFCSHFLNMNLQRLRITKSFTISDFDTELRTLLLRAIEKPILFHIREEELTESKFIERVNVLISECFVPGLFIKDDYNNLLNTLKEHSRANKVIVDSEDDLIEYFVSRVRANLRVVYTANSASTNINLHSVTFPSLFTRSAMIWVNNWVDKSFKDFVTSLLKDKDMMELNEVIDPMIRIHGMARAMTEGIPSNPYVSPRHFYDFSYKFVSIYDQKRLSLREHQSHISNGLGRLNQAQLDVDKLSQNLEEYDRELREREVYQEAKLQQLVDKKQITTNKKTEAEDIKNSLEQKRNQIRQDEEEARRELSSAEPALEEARTRVNSISRSDLDVFSKMSNPPDVVKDILSAVLCLIGQPSNEWPAIRKSVLNEHFIKAVLDFDADSASETVYKMASEKIQETGVTSEKAERGFRALKPLFEWLKANLKYMEITYKIQPLRERLSSIKKEADEMEVKYTSITAEVNELDEKIKTVEAEFMSGVSETEAIRKESINITERRERAISLLSSLSSECERWDSSNKNYEKEEENLVGNALLSSAFITYCGFFDQSLREKTINLWKDLLKNDHISFSEDFQVSTFMASPETIVEWVNNKLPVDNLCTQNAVILSEQISKTPFVIDPAGQALDFLVNLNKDMLRTSFLDPKFSKHLESAIRFGSTILVEDGEQIDPIVYPIISRDFRKYQSRVTVKIRDVEIDVVPGFKMIIFTRDPDFRPSPSVASNSAIISFSVTSVSLRAQCISRLLSLKHPDVENKRQNLGKTLATMQVKLHRLEEQLLNVFSATNTDILGDDSLQKILEKIKAESTEIEKRRLETKEALAKVEETSKQFNKVADIATSLFFALKDMSTVHSMYQFSLSFFWVVYDASVLNNNNPAQIIEAFAKNLLIKSSYSLLNVHLPVLGFRFAQILNEYHNIKINPALYDLALRGSTNNEYDANFMKLDQNTDLDKEFSEWINSESPESAIPKGIKENLKSEHDCEFYLKVLALMRKLRPDRIVPSLGKFVSAAFGQDLLAIPPINLVDEAAASVSTMPFLLCSSPGHDPSLHLEKQAHHPVVSLAIGSEDSLAEIELAVKHAASNGHWAIVKNVHLTPDWARDFVKTIPSLNPNSNFRLFMTSNINPRFSASLLSSSRIVVQESATGIRANLERIYSSGVEWPNVPPERKKLVLAFIWMHSVIMERLRFCPISWSKSYDFGENDLRFALQVGMRWVEEAASGRSHISQDQFPWYALRYLLSKCVYGGRVDMIADERALQGMCEVNFSPGAKIGEGRVDVPDVSNIVDFKKWIDSLPIDESPELLWLPKNSGKYLFMKEGALTLQKILGVIAGNSSCDIISEALDEGSFALTTIRKWHNQLSSLSISIPPEDKTSLLKNAMIYELRQINETKDLIYKDLSLIIDNISRNVSFGQHEKSILHDISSGNIPKNWNVHEYNCTDLLGWFENFVERIMYINECVCSDDSGKNSLKLGLFSHPESLIAAAKQATANEKGWPMEKVHVFVSVDKEPSSSHDLCVVDSTLMCAQWSEHSSSLQPSDDVLYKMPPFRISFSLEEPTKGTIVPCFTTQRRNRLVFETRLPASDDKDDTWWTIRSPSIILQKDVF